MTLINIRNYCSFIDEFLRRESKEYEIGKRHLANMMGQPADTFTQKDVNVSFCSN